MTTHKITKNVIIFVAALSYMEKSYCAGIPFQLIERTALKGVRPNVYIYNSIILACVRYKLWQTRLELFKKVDGAQRTPRAPGHLLLSAFLIEVEGGGVGRPVTSWRC